MEQFLRVGVITRSHGVHGEVKVFPTTDSPSRFGELTEVIIKGPKGDLNAEVEGVKYFKNLAIVKFSCFSNPEDAQGYAGSDIMIDRSYAQPLEEGEYYIADLIGCRVITDDCSEGFCEGSELGILKDVLQTGANDVYLVARGSEEILLPVIKDCIKNVDIENSVITVHLMKGLL